MKRRYTGSTLVWLISTLIAILCIAPDWSYATSISTLETQLKSKPERRDIRENLGSAYFKIGRFKDVASVLGPYSNEISQDSLILLAESYGKVGDSLNQIRTLQNLREKNPNRFRPYFLLGMAYMSIKKWDEAAENFRLSVARAPKHRPSYDALVEIFSENKQNYEIRNILNDMIKIFGQKKEFTNLMCKINAQDGFVDQALETCKKAVGQDPKHPDNHIYLAQVYYNSDNRVAAEKIFTTAARQFKKSEFVQYATGEYYMSEKNFSTAARYLENATKINSASMRAHLTLAQALFETRNYTKALIHFEKSCQIDKSSETTTAIKNAAAKLRQSDEVSLSEQYSVKAAVCQPLKR